MGDDAALARLPEAAERLMWERIIADAEAQAPLLHVPQAAAAAQEAYGLVLAWRLPEAELRKAATQVGIADGDSRAAALAGAIVAQARRMQRGDHGKRGQRQHETAGREAGHHQGSVAIAARGRLVGQDSY